MKTQLTINSQPVTLSFKYKGVTTEFSQGLANYQFRIFLSTDKGKTSFIYTDSAHNYQLGKTELTEDDLKNALESYLLDATAGDMSFEDFCSEFGYDTDSRKAEKTYKLCVKSSNKAKDLFNDIYEASNELNEIVNA